MNYLFPIGTVFRDEPIEKATIAPAQQFQINKINHHGKELLHNVAAESEEEWLERINGLGIYPVDDSSKPDAREFSAGMPEVDRIEEGWAITAYPHADEAPVHIPPMPRLIDGNKISLGTVERLHAATTVEDLRDLMTEILLGNDVAGTAIPQAPFELP
ncbi:MAG: hypothetical protein ACNI27_08415 [Desulfovibrio sp.]